MELNLGRIDCSISKSENYSLFELRLSLESVSLNLYLPTYPPKATKTAMEIFSNQRGQTGRFIQLVVRQ